MLCLHCFNGKEGDEGHRQPKRNEASVKRPASGTDSGGIRNEASCKRRPGGGLNGGLAGTSGPPRQSSSTSCALTSSSSTSPLCTAAASPSTSCSGSSPSKLAPGAPLEGEVPAEQGIEGGNPETAECKRSPLIGHSSGPSPKTVAKSSKRYAASPIADIDGLSNDTRTGKARRCAESLHAKDDVPLPTVSRAQKAEGYLRGSNPDNVAEFGGKRGSSGDTALADQCIDIDRAYDETQSHPGAASSRDNMSQCPTCLGVHKPSRFRRVPGGTTWRGASAGTLVCNRCHLQIRWGRS